MAAYQLIAAVGTTNADGLTTFTNRPPGAPLFYLDDNGGWVPVGEAAPHTGQQSGGPTYTAGAGIDLTNNQISATGYDDAELDALLAGKADLVAGLVPASQLPSYVDDVLEVASLAAFPAPGEPGKIYVALDTNKQYRWSGSAYQVLSDSGLTQAQLAALQPLAAPVVALVGGAVKGYPTLAAAIAAFPSVIRLQANVVLDTPPSGPVYYGTALYANGYTITIASGAELRLLRYTRIYQAADIVAQGTGAISIIGGGAPANATLPPPAECVQLIESRVTAPLKFDVPSAYQGLVLRGNSAVTNLAAGGGPAYLYDLAELTGPVPAGFTLLDRRPGAATGNSFAVRSGSQLVFTGHADYGVLASGTFTVDPAGAQPGVVVRVELAAGATAPTLPSLFELINGAFVAGARNGYGFSVMATGKIEYFIYQKP